MSRDEPTAREVSPLEPYDIESTCLPLRERIYLSFLSTLCLDLSRCIRRLALTRLHISDDMFYQIYMYGKRTHELFVHLVRQDNSLSQAQEHFY